MLTGQQLICMHTLFADVGHCPNRLDQVAFRFRQTQRRREVRGAGAAVTARGADTEVWNGYPAVLLQIDFKFSSKCCGWM